MWSAWKNFRIILVLFLLQDWSIAEPKQQFAAILKTLKTRCSMPQKWLPEGSDTTEYVRSRKKERPSRVFHGSQYVLGAKGLAPWNYCWQNNSS